MKIDNTFKLREIAGATIFVNQGEKDKNFTKIISLNSSAIYLFETFKNKEFSLEDVAEALVSKYGIEKELAATDAALWVEELVECGIIIK